MREQNLMDVTDHCVTHRYKLRTRLLACVASEAALFVFNVPVPLLSSSACKPHGLFGSLPFVLNLLEVFCKGPTLLFCNFTDECFEVEQQCQHLISEIEQVLGEPLQKYF